MSIALSLIRAIVKILLTEVVTFVAKYFVARLKDRIVPVICTHRLRGCNKKAKGKPVLLKVKVDKKTIPCY